MYELESYQVSEAYRFDPHEKPRWEEEWGLEELDDEL